MNMDNYPHVTIAEDGSLCSTSQHRPGFPRVLYDTLRQLGYNGDAPVYRGRMSMAHGQDKCEVNVLTGQHWQDRPAAAFALELA
jgi:hypothetical protein